tara:strand:+ start:721 stop:2343 length:1623 start_codon:yes stop_codon:yes gene_type:complete
MAALSRLIAKELSSALGITDSSSVSKSSIPKSSMNPLVKSRSEAFDSAAISETDSAFYSPVISTIDQMTIGKKGSKGQNISAFLQKRAPNVEKAELDSFDLNLEPNRIYTRKEVLDIAKEKGSKEYTIEVVNPYKVDTFRTEQRQMVADKEKDFITLALQGNKNYVRGEFETHFGGTKNLGHTRSSIREVMPKGGPLTKKIKDRERYLLLEEIQSDTAKTRSANKDEYAKPYSEDRLSFDAEFGNDDIYNYIVDGFNDLRDNLDFDFNVEYSTPIVNTIKQFYFDVYTKSNITSMGEVSIQKKLIKNKDSLKKLLKDKHKIKAEGTDIDQISSDAIKKNLSSYMSADLENPTMLDEIDGTFSYLNTQIRDTFTEKFKVGDLSKSPVLSRSDYLKRLILANISYAKKNDINKIVIPDYKEIARQRTNTFDEVVSEDSPIFAKYEKARKTGDHGKVAQEYFENVFKKTYKDAMAKVLNSLKNETKGKIKIGTRQLKYPDLTQKSRYRTSTATEIDISNFNYNPETQQLRFSEGGLVKGLMSR